MESGRKAGMERPVRLVPPCECQLGLSLASSFSSYSSFSSSATTTATTANTTTTTTTTTTRTLFASTHSLLVCCLAAYCAHRLFIHAVQALLLLHQLLPLLGADPTRDQFDGCIKRGFRYTAAHTCHCLLRHNLSGGRRLERVQPVMTTTEGHTSKHL